MSFVLPNNETKLLLHICCAPCSAWIIQQLVASNIDVSVFFYNPNIYPRKEYDCRREEVIRFVESIGVKYIEGEYDYAKWQSCTKGLECAPERGLRCTECFNLRFHETAKYAAENGFKVFATSLTISRFKDAEQVNACGRKAATKHGVSYWDYNWRKDGGEILANRLAKEENFYRQKYCGCEFSIGKTKI